jgi:transposase
MDFLGRGNTKAEAARVFELHWKTVYRWGKRQKTGVLAATVNRNRKPKKIDPEKLRAYLTAHPDETLKQIGAAFGASDVAAYYRIRQLGFTLKKKPFYMKKGTKMNGRSFEN